VAEVSHALVVSHDLAGRRLDAVVKALSKMSCKRRGAPLPRGK
jgi:hypothetical protein